MTQPEFNDQKNDEKPLDPAVEQVQIKLRRLLAGSSLVMVAGLIAVFAAIFYKINSSGPDASTTALPATIAIGEGRTVEQVDWVDGSLFVLASENGSKVLLQIDPGSGRILGRTLFVSQ